MTRPLLIRVLLSLLLLVSQHMASAHALSHWSGSIGSPSALHVAGDDLSSAFAQDQSCDACLAFAQLAGPLGHTQRAFVAPELQSQAIIGADEVAAHCRIRLAFQSRAPPQA